MPFSLTYVSKSRIDVDDAAEIVDQIVVAARENNSAAGLTGALIFTGTDFAQTLEGDEAEVRKLMERISKDDRHEYIEIIYSAEHPHREYADWKMAYRGITTFVQRHVEAARGQPGDPAGDDAARHELRQLMRGFAISAAD